MSARNPKVQRLRRLARRRRDRAEERAFVLEGPHLVEAALDAGATVESVFAEPGADQELLARAAAGGADVYELEPGTLERVADTVTPQPVMAVAPKCDVRLDDSIAAAVNARKPIVVVVDVQDPGNVGTLLRTAEASGAASIVVCGTSADPFGPKAARASAGALFHVPVTVEPDPASVLEALSASGVRTVATDAEAASPVQRADLSGSVALVFGNEAEGLGPSVLDRVDEVVAVPIDGQTESLNVAAAGAVVCFEARRQRASRESDGAEAMDVVATVSHELRSPLTSIQGYTALLLNRWERFSDEQKHVLLEEMGDDAARVGRLVGELLDVSRIETGRLALNRQGVDLAAAARAAVDRVTMQHPELEATVEFPESLPRVQADPDKIQQVLLNLMENAAKYANPAGVRVVGEQLDDERVAVSVIDQGAGISAADLARVFTKFYRREDQRPSGIGLGLWISRRLVEAHGGTLTASSNVGAGTTFCLTLPV